MSELVGTPVEPASTGSLPLGIGLSPTPALTAQAVADCFDWLSFHRDWGELDEAVLKHLSQALHPVKVESDTEIYREGQTAIGLYLLKWGSVESYRASPVERMHIRYYSAGNLLGYVPLVEASAQSQYQASAITLTPCELWFLRQADFAALLETYPQIQALLNRFLAQDIAQFTQRISQEQLRIQGLQRYLRPVPGEEPLLGHSKAAQKLVQQLEAAAADLAPVIFQAASGTGKTFLAGYIHQHSGLKHRGFAEIDCAQLPRDQAGGVQTDALFGRGEDLPGVIELLERGTLLIENEQLLPTRDRNRLFHYLATGTFSRNPVAADSSTRSSTPSPPSVEAWVRLILARPTRLTVPNLRCHHIKLFNLAQRKEDISDFTEYFLEKFCEEHRRTPLSLDQGNLRRLISYAYPGNVSELAGILKRAVMMTPADQSTIPESVLWSVQSEKNAFRIDLLDHVPWLRQFLLSPWWPERFWVPVMALFVPVTILGLVGPQTRDASMTLNLFWAWWWPFYLFLFAFVGRLWCAICPFMVTGEWLRTLSLWLWPRKLRPWPTKWMNRWGAWVLFAGFLSIYLWEQLWDLPHTAYLSAWLLILIAAGAVMGSLIYERRLWCRYLCPIGGMNGLFAKLSMIEVRSTQQVCGSQCSTFGCYKGSAATPVTFAQALPTEGQATDGCPLYSHPAQLQDNRDCVLCMTCLKACPHRSVQVNLKFPASDLLENQQGFWAEAALLLLLFGGVFMHHDHQILSWFGYGDWPIDADHLWRSIPVVTGLLSMPLVLTYLVHRLARLLDRDMPEYLKVVYAYLPFTLAANLAHYVPAAITEAGQILPVIARTLGYSGAHLPTLTWSLEVAHFLQGITLLSALVFSIYPLLRITQRPWQSNLPHLGLMAGLTVFCFYLLIV
jgi:polyferredoxin/CRP-like cAMP-binding protein